MTILKRILILDRSKNFGHSPVTLRKHMARINYLNNKDILKEIHKSKTSYCSYTSEEYKDFDLILPSVDKINVRTIAAARKNRAARLASIAHQEALLDNPKAKLAEFAVNPKKIDKKDLIFRIMCWDHIPEEPGRKKNPKNPADFKAKINFPPFQHFKFDKSDKITCVGKSHWIGGLKNGYFSVTHGNITNKLALMFMKLCERYGTRSNWRGYTYNDEMKNQALLHLIQIGLQFDENKSDNPFAYYTASITNSFTRILNIEKKHQDIRDDILEMNNKAPSYTRQGRNNDSMTGGGIEE